jgi:phosphoglycerate dehydrogenase-like enzyme
VSDRSRVVVVGATSEDPPPGIHVVERVVDVGYAATVEDLVRELEGADVVLAWRPNRNGALLPQAWEHARTLRWIQAASAGVDGLLFPELVESHVVLTNARGVFDAAIAEYVVGLMLAFAKDLVGMLDGQHRREWRHGDIEMLEGKHLLVVGMGPIGKRIGRAGRDLGMLVRGLARTRRPGDSVFNTIHGSDELIEALGWADYVVNALPATTETHHRFDVEAFSAMHPWVRFINVGRGSTVDEPALVRALTDGTISAAALDVFEAEPLPADSPLWGLPNVVISPHRAGDFAGWREALVELFVENLERYLTGNPLRNVVDKRLGFVP